MHDIRIDLGGEARVLQPTQAYVIGRGQIADVTVDDPAVSRHHLDLVADGTSWVVSDRSSAGSYIGDERIDTRRVDGPMAVRLGPPGAPELRLEPVRDLEPPKVAVHDDRSQVGTIAVDDRALRLDLGDVHRAFAPGTRVVVGRNPSCDLVADDRLVGREHCAFDWEGDGWVLTDLGSTRGTYIDGRKVTKPTSIEGALHVMLGGASAGSQLRVVTAGEHTPPTNRGGLVTALVALAAVVVAVIAGFVLWPDGDGPNTAVQLAAAKSSTVFVIYLDPDGSGGNGSGAFVADDLVLTNRHVAEAGEELLLGVSDGEDEPVTIRYRGELEASHPYLDLALVRVSGAVEIGDSGIVDLPNDSLTPPGVLPIGESAGLRSGDGLHALGFPAVTTIFGNIGDELITPAVSVSEGEIVTFQPWPSCDNPDAADVFLVPGSDESRCSTDGTLPRGNMVTSDLSGSGGSGGPVVVDGRLVAVRYAGREALSRDTGAVSTAGTAISIPIEYARPWLEAYLAR